GCGRRLLPEVVNLDTLFSNERPTVSIAAAPGLQMGLFCFASAVVSVAAVRATFDLDSDAALNGATHVLVDANIGVASEFDSHLPLGSIADNQAIRFFMHESILQNFAQGEEDALL